MQFHVAGGPEAQRTPLPVKVVLPDHASLLERLELVKASLENTKFGFERRGDLVTITDPFGQLFEVHQPSKDDVYERGIKDILLSCAPGTAAAIGAFYEKFYKVIFLDFQKPDQHEGRLATVLAITPASQATTGCLSPNKRCVQACIVSACMFHTVGFIPYWAMADQARAMLNKCGSRKGFCSQPVLPLNQADARGGVGGRFLRHIHRLLLLTLPTFMQARVAYGSSNNKDSASVLFGPSSTVTFVEDEEYKTAEAAIGDFEGWHIAFYLADFSSTYNAVDDAGINLLDHKYNDKAPTLEDALKWSQFRMTDIIAVHDSPNGSLTKFQKGDVLYSFGHEVRSLYHPRYMRSLYNKGTNVYDDHGPNLL